MKTQDIRFALFFLAVAVFTVAASTIEWSRDGSPIFQVQRTGPPRQTVEFGLRSDGVVVWREITHGVSTTNSPAELPDPPANWDWHTNWYNWRTNNVILLTNVPVLGNSPFWYNNGGTNLILSTNLDHTNDGEGVR